MNQKVFDSEKNLAVQNFASAGLTFILLFKTCTCLRSESISPQPNPYHNGNFLNVIFFSTCEVCKGEVDLPGLLHCGDINIWYSYPP